MKRTTGAASRRPTPVDPNPSNTPRKERRVAVPDEVAICEGFSCSTSLSSLRPVLQLEIQPQPNVGSVVVRSVASRTIVVCISAIELRVARVSYREINVLQWPEGELGRVSAAVGASDCAAADRSLSKKQG